MRIRIKKPPPAPLMDGFDLSRFQFGRTYHVDARLGRYLVFAGYGEDAPPEVADEKPSRRRRKTRENT